MKKMKKNNKGFSLVELIIVIAIMAVLVGVLAPQFIKYVEQSRRGTDIQNAEQIRSAILADIADGEITGSGTNVEFTGAGTTDGDSASTIATAPETQGSVANLEEHFYVTYDATTGECAVSVLVDSTYFELTDPDGAQDYKEE